MAMNPVELRIIIDAQNKASAVLAKANKDVKALSAANATMLASVNPSAVTGMTRGFANIGLAATAAGTRIAAAGSAFTAFAGKYWMVGAAGIAMGAAAKSGALLEARIGALGDNVEETKEKLKNKSITHDTGYRNLGLLRGHNVLSPTQLTASIDHWDNPGDGPFAKRNKWSLYNACTEALKSTNQRKIMEKHIALHHALS